MGYIGVVSCNPLTNHSLTSWDIQVCFCHEKSTLNFEALGNSQGVEERVANMVTAVETRRCFFGDLFVFFQVYQTDEFLMFFLWIERIFFRCGLFLLVKGWGNNSKLDIHPKILAGVVFQRFCHESNAWNGYFFGKSLEQFVPKKHFVPYYGCFQK